MKIYVASSWRNTLQPSVVSMLRVFGHEVYDFRHPATDRNGFAWRDCGSMNAYTVSGYLQAIQSQRAQEGFALDKQALDWCDVCVMVLPCGRSAHLEAGYACGQGKRVYFLLHETAFEPELMYLLGTACATTLTEILEHLRNDSSLR